ncbi:hypothetical protein [Sphingobacterium tabacisoli]|nr:hypothetical protein [Sphingobacterium tabacisoli]
MEVKAKEIKILAATMKYNKTMEGYKKLNDLTIQYYKDLYQNVAKFQIASTYFDESVDSILAKLSNALYLNFQNNLLTDESYETTPPELKTDFETIDTLINSRVLLFNSMMNEIAKSYEEQYRK